MLREVWRLQRDHFWTPNMSGTDWNSVYERYAPLLDRVATRGELSDLIWEMQGELERRTRTRSAAIIASRRPSPSGILPPN
jgi:hypothetical protein